MKLKIGIAPQQTLYLYVILMGLVGGMAVAYAFLHLPKSDAALLFMLLGLTVLAQAGSLPLFGETSVSMSYALAFVALLVYGPAGAILVNLLSGLVHAVYPKRRPWFKVLFNLGALSASASVSGFVYWLAGGHVPPSDLVGNIGPALLAGLAYFFFNTAAVSLAITLANGQPFLKVWNTNHRWLVLHFLAVAIISMAMATIFRIDGPLGVLIFSPTLAVPWLAATAYVKKLKEIEARNVEFERENRDLRRAYEDLQRRFQGRSHPGGATPIGRA